MKYKVLQNIEIGFIWAIVIYAIYFFKVIEFYLPKIIELIEKVIF